MCRAMFIVASMLLASASCLMSAEKPEPKLSPAEQKAVAKYDHLPDAWKKKAVAHWKEVYKLSKKNKKVLKNEGPIYPELIGTDKRGDVSITKDSWGVLHYESVNEGGIIVVQVINKNRVLCQHSQYFFVDTDTAGMVDGKQTKFDGLYYVSGTETYKTANGTSNTVFVIKPLPKMEE